MSMPSLDELQLYDDVKSAKAAIRHWDAELGRRILAAQALDGPSGWMSKVLGRYDDDVDAAVDDVQQARGALAKAHRDVIAAKAAVEAFKHGKVQASEDLVQRMVDVETRAAAVRAGGGPAAEALLDLEARCEPAERRVDRIRGATEATTELAMQLTRVRTVVTKSRPAVSRNNLPNDLSMFTYRNPVLPATDRAPFATGTVEVTHLAEATLSWEGEMLSSGLPEPEGFHKTVERLLVLDGLHSDANELDTKVLVLQGLVEPCLRDLQTQLADATALAKALQVERATLLGFSAPT